MMNAMRLVKDEGESWHKLVLVISQKQRYNRNHERPFHKNILHRLKFLTGCKTKLNKI